MFGVDNALCGKPSLFVVVIIPSFSSSVEDCRRILAIVMGSTVDKGSRLPEIRLSFD